MLKDYVKTVYLASQSLGRRGILEGEGLNLIICPTDCDESGKWDSPASMVHDLALRKLNAFISSGKFKDRSLIAIASDTVVVIDGKVIGKAKTAEEAVSQLKMLSSNIHYVYSSYALCINGKIYSGYDKSSVYFKDINSMIDSYIAGMEWNGAAGSYRIQGMGKSFIDHIEGDINTVIGLPLKKIEEIVKNSRRILVHCCCGPCSTSSIKTLLSMGYLPVLYYENSNIYPLEENNLRFENLKKVASVNGLELIRGEYNHSLWLDFIKGLENEPEHGKRCLKCFEYNLCSASKAAAARGIDFFTTTLTVSRFKSSSDIFTVGSAFLGFVPIDFKKNKGFEESVNMAKEMGLYRQQYCGCEFSLRRE